MGSPPDAESVNNQELLPACSADPGVGRHPLPCKPLARVTWCPVTA